MLTPAPSHLSPSLRLLIVEDEPLLAMLLEDILRELGHTVPVVCNSVEAALEAIETETLEGAFLDLNLHGMQADPVAASLVAKRVPFVIATGGVQDAEAMGALALVAKPYRFSDIENAVGNFFSEVND